MASLAVLALAVTLPASCLCAPATPAPPAGHDCCAPPLGLSAAGHGCCDGASVAAVPGTPAPPATAVAAPGFAVLAGDPLLLPSAPHAVVCAPSPPHRVLRI
jgi:hypothetical protein